MMDIDIDAAIALARAMGFEFGEGDIAKLVEAIRKADVLLTSRNAVSLDEEEQAAMDHLLAVRKQILEWYGATDSEEQTAATHVLQAFIVQHMLHRLNPEQWAAWPRIEPDR